MKIFNKTLRPELINELQNLEVTCFTYDEPVPFYKDLKIYPIIMRRYLEFISASKCCLINKNDDPEGIAYSHLGYLLKQIEEGQNGHILYAQLTKLVELSMQIPSGLYCTKCHKIIEDKDIKNMSLSEKENYTCQCGSTDFEDNVRIKTNAFTFKPEFWIKDYLISPVEFDRLRQIVIYQNFPDYQDDSWVNAEVRADQAEKQELLNKRQQATEASLEKKMICVSAVTNYKMPDIYNLTMRKFLMLLTTVDDVINYTATRIGAMTGMVSVKHIEHWIYKPASSLYGESVSSSSYTNKIQSANG